MTCKALWGAPPCGWHGTCAVNSSLCVCEAGWQVLDFPVHEAVLCERKDQVVRALYCTYAVIIWFNAVLINVVAYCNFKLKRKNTRKHLKIVAIENMGFFCLLVCASRGFASAQGELFTSPLTLSFFFCTAAFFNMAHEEEICLLIEACAQICIFEAKDSQLSSRRISEKRTLFNLVKYTHVAYFVFAIVTLFYGEERANLVLGCCVIDFFNVLLFNHSFKQLSLPLKKQIEDLLELTLSQNLGGAQPLSSKNQLLVERLQHGKEEIKNLLAARRVFFYTRSVVKFLAIIPLTLSLFDYVYMGFLLLSSFNHFVSLLQELKMLFRYYEAELVRNKKSIRILGGFRSTVTRSTARAQNLCKVLPARPLSTNVNPIDSQVEGLSSTIPTQ